MAIGLSETPQPRQATPAKPLLLDVRARVGEKAHQGIFWGRRERMSGLLATAKPYRIKAAHRRRRKVAVGPIVQRYYDPGIGRFLSVDPVTANSNTGANFNRYWYANNNPYKFTDPDGRAPCTGTRIGTCVNGATVTGISQGQLNAVKRNPQAYIDRLNQIPNKQSSEPGSARYFAKTALPVTATTGREVGADIAKTGDGYTVANYALGEPASGDGSGAVSAGQAYAGPGTRVALIHTHPANTNFSGLPGGYSGGRWTGYINYGGDLERSVFAGVNGYVVMLNGGILKFDYEAMASDALKPGANLNAESYISRLP